MAKRRIKIIWGGAEEIPGQWRLGVWGTYERDRGSRIKGHVVSLRGVLRFAGLSALGCYLAGAVALYAWFAHNPYNRVTFADTVLLPFRWAQVREVRGQMMIEEGLADLKAQRWSEAVMKLYAGLARAPHHNPARLALAQFNVMANRRPEALKVLTEDLANGYPGRRYLETLFALASEGEDFDLIVAAGERFATAGTADDAAWLTVQYAQALVRAGRAEEAVRFIEAKGDAAGKLLKEAKVLALLELKRAPEAVDYLAQWRRAPGANPGQIVRLQVRAAREAGDLPAMERALEEFRQLTPADPRTYAYGIVQRALAGQVALADAGVSDFFLRFSSAKDKLTLLATACAEAKQPALVKRCADEAALHGYPSLAFDYALLQTQLATGDWTGAAQTLPRIAAKTDMKKPSEKFMLEWVTALVGATVHADEGQQTVLLGFLQQRPVSMKLIRLTGEALVLAQRYPTAQRVLEIGERAYPGSRTLAGLKRQVEAGLKPAEPAVVEAAVPVEAVREKGFFEALEQARAAQRWEEAAQSIREVLVAKPAWLAAREAELREWQLRIDVRTEDMPELLQAASAYLDGSTARAVKTFEIAQQLDQLNRREDAERLLREILKKNPEFPAATRLIKQWQQPAAKAGGGRP